MVQTTPFFPLLFALALLLFTRLLPAPLMRKWGKGEHTKEEVSFSAGPGIKLIWLFHPLRMSQNDFLFWRSQWVFHTFPPIAEDLWIILLLLTTSESHFAHGSSKLTTIFFAKFYYLSSRLLVNSVFWIKFWPIIWYLGNISCPLSICMQSPQTPGFSAVIE